MKWKKSNNAKQRNGERGERCKPRCKQKEEDKNEKN